MWECEPDQFQIVKCFSKSACRKSIQELDMLPHIVAPFPGLMFAFVITALGSSMASAGAASGLFAAHRWRICCVF